MTVNEFHKQYRRIATDERDKKRFEGLPINLSAFPANLAFVKQNLQCINFVLDDVDEIFELLQTIITGDDIASFEYILDNGFDINTCNSKFEPIFLYDRFHFVKKLNFIKLAREKGADYTLKDGYNYDFFSKVAMNRYHDQEIGCEILGYLLSLPEATSRLTEGYGSGSTGLSANKTLFHLAIEAGKASEAKMLLDFGFSVDTTFSFVKSSGPFTRVITQNAMHDACIRGNSEMVEFLIQNGGDAGYPDSDGMSPLHHTVTMPFFRFSSGEFYRHMQERLRILELLTAAGADLNAKCDGETPLLYLLYKRLFCSYTLDFADPLMFKLISLGADTSAATDNGTSILHLAAQYGNYDLFRLCVGAGSDINAKNNKGETPLMRACRGSYPNNKIIMALIKLGGDANVKDLKGESALDTLIKKGNAKMVEYILSLK